MNSKIITKFTVVTEDGMDALLLLTRGIALEKFSGLVPQDVLDEYILNNFNEQTLIVEVNSMSNQWLVVYSGNDPAGYARLTSKGNMPHDLQHKRTIRIADFGILKQFEGSGAGNSLMEKCLTVCRPYEAIWVTEYAEDPFLPYFEAQGFIRKNSPAEMELLPLAAVSFIREQSA